jgi:hypothetical protein
MNAPAPPVTYTARANVFEHEATWRLAPDALERIGGPTQNPKAVQRFPYRDVSELWLSFAPTRFDRERYRCELRMRTGQRVRIFSTHYQSIGNFEDRAVTYVPFARGLVARVAGANPACRFRSGKSRLAYVLEHAFLLAALILLVLVIGMVGGANLSQLVMVKLAILAFYIPVAILYARKNWPRQFDARAIPEDVLPKSAD